MAGDGGGGCINGTHFVLCNEGVFEMFTVEVGLITYCALCEYRNGKNKYAAQRDVRQENNK